MQVKRLVINSHVEMTCVILDKDTGIGFAVRNSIDEWNDELACNIAAERATNNIYRGKWYQRGLLKFRHIKELNNLPKLKKKLAYTFFKAIQMDLINEGLFINHKEYKRRYQHIWFQRPY